MTDPRGPAHALRELADTIDGGRPVRWEYTQDSCNDNLESWWNLLRCYGKEGWEAWDTEVRANGIRTTYFKRQMVP